MSTKTIIPYMYRDADNYKQHGEIVLSGSIADEQKQTIKDSLGGPASDQFIPDQVGQPGLQEMFDNGWDEDADHPWHEIDVNDIFTSDSDFYHPETSVDEFVSSMEEAKADGWDDVGADFDVLGSIEPEARRTEQLRDVHGRFAGRA